MAREAWGHTHLLASQNRFGLDIENVLCSVTECWKPERRGGNWLEVTSACCVQAVDSRDSMAMALYSQCFNWIICRLNSRIRGKEDFKSISILDIFGFENFEVSLRRETHRGAGKTPRLLNEGLLDLTESMKCFSLTRSIRLNRPSFPSSDLNVFSHI